MRCCTEDDYTWGDCTNTYYPDCGGGQRYRRDKTHHQHVRKDGRGCKQVDFTVTQRCPTSTWQEVFYNSREDLENKRNVIGRESVQNIDCRQVTGRVVHRQNECSVTGQSFGFRNHSDNSVTTFCCKPNNIDIIFEVYFKSSESGRLRRRLDLTISLNDWIAMEDDHKFIDDIELSTGCFIEWSGNTLTLTKKQWNDGDIPYVFEKCSYRDMGKIRTSEGNRFISIYSYFRFRSDSYCEPPRNGQSSEYSYGASDELLNYYLAEAGLGPNRRIKKESRDMVWL